MQELISTFHIDTKLLIAQIVNFAIVLFVLYRFAFKPLVSLMNERTKTISQGLDDAEEAKKTLLMAEDEKAGIVKEARVLAHTTLAQAGLEGKALIKQAEADARLEKEKIMNETKAQIDQERAKLEQELQSKTAQLVVDSVTKILKENMTAEKNETFVKDFMVHNRA